MVGEVKEEGEGGSGGGRAEVVWVLDFGLSFEVDGRGFLDGWDLDWGFFLERLGLGIGGLCYLKSIEELVRGK